MSSIFIAVIGVGALALGYRIYGRKVSKWCGLRQDATMPAVALYDGVDYVPAKHWSILFGHHFASIAGAAPIMGPVIACMYWGWVPALLWIVLGGIFFGAVHDYCALVASVENGGLSVSALSESVLGRFAKIAFSIFVLLALILVVAVFAAVAGKTLADTPQTVVPTFGLIFVAMGVGLLVYRTNVPVALDTAIGLLLLLGLLVLGYHVPVELPVEHAAQWWAVILVVYGMVAAVLPVWLLLQPRDHLSTGVLFFGVFFGFLGVFLTHPTVKSPAFVAFGSADWGAMWPMLFVVIACGAISGFHSLVASGTTSKQLARAADARRIGYGGMLMESAVSVLAVIAVVAGLYWTRAPAGMEGYVYQELMKGGNWIGTFGEGYGRLTAPIFGALGALVGITLLEAFVITTLDTATRITRYVASELLADAFGIPIFKNRYLTTLLIGVCAAALALGNWRAIWPVFGSANQLIAGMVLLIATVYLLSRGRSWAFTAVPAVLVFVTAMAALVYSLLAFTGATQVKSLPRSNLLAVIAAILIVVGLSVAIKGLTVFRAALRGSGVVAAVAPEAGEGAEMPGAPGC